MFLSIFDILRFGIAPQSSHTMGPKTAAVRLLKLLQERCELARPVGLRVRLYGSLAFTGKGHATDRAVAIGLLGFRSAT